MEKRFKSPDFNYEVTIGKFAQQADGAVWFQQGETVILATVVSARASEFPGFLPLTTDYREHAAAAGKIPGGYLKREGRSSDKEILTSRLIDRAVRPLFPDNYFNQLQLLATVYSVDKEFSPYALSLIASSLALSISKIPFLGPVGAVEVARVNGEWIFNPLYSQSILSDVKIMVAGTDEGICMVEGRSNHISEDEFVDVLFKAHDLIKKQVAWQKEIVAQVGVAKEPIVDQFDWADWKKRASDYLTDDRLSTLETLDKVKRSTSMSELQKGFVEASKAHAAEVGTTDTFLNYIFDTVLEHKLTQRIFKNGHRVDLRGFNQVREISTEVGLLPRNHGSALFKRGRTQALVSVTLGGGQDEQKIDDIMSEEVVERSFMLHYNFPSFSVGEVKPSRGPGRREIGHGYLAASALKAVLPAEEKFPYTIRIVCDILESDGSSSMATVCGSTMALMNAGVPITDMVSGIAMGLLANDAGDFTVLSDIAGIEDAFGLMDFKVTGTDKGITAIQMDIKYKGGLKREVFEKALAQAREGRLFILGEMRKVMSAPNPTLSEYVPQITSFVVPTDKIGAIIGTGGKVIRDIIDKTGTTIDIEDDGMVKIFGHPGPKLDQAIMWVKTLAGLIEKGAIYHGKVRKITDFGLFVELVPGQDGLVHVSSIPKQDQDALSRLKSDDPLDVEVIDYDESTGRIRLKVVK